MSINNIQLNAHSHYSLLSGVAKIDDLIECAIKNKTKSLALTDTNNLYGAIEFYKKAREKKIKPILGVSLFLNTGNEMYSRLTLLAKNPQGYENILKIVTKAQSNTNSIPSIETKQMEGDTEGIIAIAPFANSEFTNALLQNDDTKIDSLLTMYSKLFSNNLFFAISKLDELPNNVLLEDKIKNLSTTKGVPLVASQPIYYLNKEDREIKDLLIKIRGARRPSLEEDIFEGSFTHYPSVEEMNEWFSDNKDALSNLEMIDKSISFEIELGCETKNWIFPKIDIKNRDPDELLREKVYEGIKKRNLEETDELKERIEYELKIILDKKYATYFLLYIDITEYCIKHKIPTNTRGSSAGSMVAYLTYITTVNPIEHGIAFERFLNPYRPSAPDIDLDIAYDRRGGVLNYISKQYGEDKVGQLGTFGTMLSRAAIRDVARAFGYPYTTGDRIAKLIPIPKQGFTVSIDDAKKEVKELASLYKKNEDVKKILDTAEKIEGNARHISIHASGVMVAPKKLIKYTPLQPDPREQNKIITQYDMYGIGEDGLGLTKLDILGIAFLTIIANTIKRVKENSGEEIDLFKITYDDKGVYEMIGRGHTVGVFQFGSSGIIRVLTRFRPTNLYEIASMIALYRPGPMSIIDEYIKRKSGEKPIEYFHKKMEKYLNRSFGMLVYQDDVLYTAIEIAGYNWDEVDVFRKAIGKKIPKLMQAQKKNFIDRCEKHSKIPKADAEKIWELFDPFSRYGFNKAHAFSYAQITYQTAYLKYHYTPEYIASLLTNAEKKLDTLSEYARECKLFNLSLLGPDVNKSGTSFSVGENRKEIRFGLSAIKTLGGDVADAIVADRKENGEFTSLADFIERISKKSTVNKRHLISLIQVGALDVFGNRGDLLETVDMMLEYAKEVSNTNTSATLLFDTTPDKNIPIKKGESISKEQSLFWERDLLGVYISGHPLQQYEKKGVPLKQIIERLSKDESAITTVFITNIKFVFTKKGNTKIAFITLEDEYDSIEAVCFSDTLSKYEELLAVNRVVQVQGKLSIRNEERSMVVEEVKDVEKIKS